MDEWAAAEVEARGHWGVMTLEQFRPLGIGTNAIRWATRRGRLVPLFRGAFRFAAVPPCWQQNAWLATALGGEGSALSHATAASIWRLNGYQSSRMPVHVSIPTRRMLRLPAGRFVLHRPRSAFGVYPLEGFKVTRLARTIVDVSESVDDEQLEIILDTAQQRFDSLPAWLAGELPLHPPRSRPGLGRLIRLLEARQGVATESPLETQSRRQLRTSGLPAPQLQFNVYDAAGFIMRADAAWPGHLVAVHIDSFLWHATRAQFDRDAQQRRRLVDSGWLSLVVTEPDLADGDWLLQLARTLQRRAPQRDLFLAAAL